MNNAVIRGEGHPVNVFTVHVCDNVLDRAVGASSLESSCVVCGSEDCSCVTDPMDVIGNMVDLCVMQQGNSHPPKGHCVDVLPVGGGAGAWGMGFQWMVVFGRNLGQRPCIRYMRRGPVQRTYFL